MKSLLIFAVLTGFAPLSFAGVDFEKCREEVQQSETDAVNADNTGPAYSCEVEILSTNTNPGNACVATFEFKITCTSSERAVSLNGGACCE